MDAPLNKLLVLLLCLAFPAGTAIANQTSQQTIMVFGATGKVGSQVVNEALQRGHRVNAVSRDPSRIDDAAEGLNAVEGNLLDNETLADLIKDQDVIVLSVRGVFPDAESGHDTVVRQGVENIIEAMRKNGQETQRLVHVGGSGTLITARGKRFADTIPKIFIPKELEREIEAQILALDYLKSVDDARWTYVTPAENFTNGERTGEFRIGGDKMIEDDLGRSRISRADFAVAILNEIENPEHENQRFSVAY